MENIFNEHQIPRYYFFNIEKYVKLDLWYYIYNNLHHHENYRLRWDLQNALTINANGEYI
jgi:hypothetical protein